MNVTKDGFKDRQLHIEDYLQMVSAEQKEYAEVSVYQRITENNSIITDFWTDSLMELILRKDNLNEAYKKVKSNKGKGGIDGMQVDELLPYLKENQSEIIRKIREGKYKPNPVRRVEIPKEEKGKVRKLGIPTVVDRVIQQAHGAGRRRKADSKGILSYEWLGGPPQCRSVAFHGAQL